MTFTIPILDLTPDIDANWDAYTEAIERVVRSGRFIGGPEVKAFEEEAASYLGVRHAVGLNSGTDALVIVLRALDIGPGDEVIAPPFTFFATAEAISMVGATPVFVDVEENTFNISPSLIEDAITPATRAIIPVHLFGRPAEMGPIQEIAERHRVRVVEDCAQSFGATIDGQQTGTFGEVGTFSFFPSKNLGAFGDAGMLATDDDDIDETARMLRAHGGRHKYHNELLGYNSRLDALQAAVLRVKLQHVDAANAARRHVAQRYTEALSEVEGIVVPEVTDGHVFHQYTVRILDGNRDDVAEALATEGIQTMVYYPVPCHRLPVYADRGWGPFPVTEQLCRDVLSLPMGPDVSESNQGKVEEAILAVLRD